MKVFMDLFGGMFGRSGKDRSPEPGMVNEEAGRPRRGLVAEQLPGVPYKRGDFIGQEYEVFDVLGKGGFGVVYLVYSHKVKSVLALKTFRDEYLKDAETRKLFEAEADVWVKLERHPYLVRAHFVDEVSGRLYIAMEYIVPDEQGLNSLEGYLKRRPPDLAQSLRWSIQFCHGMEYAYSKGIRCHRDIKPDNIMISQNRMVKISDFGLAGVIGMSKVMSGIKIDVQEDKVGLSCQTIEGNGVGTPTHMSPEQFTNAKECDERSDIYAFGIVMYQMASGGRLPFLAPLPKDNSKEEMMRFWRAMHKLHSESPVPKLRSPLFPIIQNCLERKPNRRYQTFKELSENLEPLLKRKTGEVIKPPKIDHKFEAWEWSQKGSSLHNIGHFDEAISCFEKAIKLDHKMVAPWNNKGSSFDSIGQFDEAIRCFDRAIELDPVYALAWSNKGSSLAKFGQFDEAIRCYNKAIKLDPDYAMAWSNKGSSLQSLGQFDEAIRCYNKAIELDPDYTMAWSNKGNSLHSLGQFDDAIYCCDRAIKLDPFCAEAWNNKGISLGGMGELDKSIRCFDKALEFKPKYVEAWNNKGCTLAQLGYFVKAVYCFEKAIKLNPKNSAVWLNKGRADEKLDRSQDAIRSYKQFIMLAPVAQYTEQIQYAQQRLRELEGR
ncbi:MAG: hypothetical protein SCARUB_02826 [Candidatus Scalindua rubra]|uniref:Protein kinase domain-containing protein n=1 Tax=Candidatus Scalindua rubra TaxID=1872076 RepID=A0A1E3X8T6_9BACT|nr:MAG: hypothetical protein SCARUB_02826 [Candidatus Scalindua rubra]